jgi:hypothetical protein
VKVRLVDVEGVELVERRGYLTLSLQLRGREGRVLLRRTEGIRDWLLSLQDCCRDSKVGCNLNLSLQLRGREGQVN